MTKTNIINNFKNMKNNDNTKKYLTNLLINIIKDEYYN